MSVRCLTTISRTAGKWARSGGTLACATSFPPNTVPLPTVLVPLTASVPPLTPNTRATQLGGEEEFNLAHILVRVPEQASPEQVKERRARAEQALSAIKGNANFAQVAASYSDAPDAMQGGQIGWRAGSRLPTLFVEVLTKLQPGESSAILRSPNGFHVLKLIERRGKDSPLIVQQTHARHILIKTSETVAESDAKQRLTQIKERLDNGGNFGELERQYSEDGSATRNGDLGWLSPSDTVPVPMPPRGRATRFRCSPA